MRVKKSTQQSKTPKSDHRCGECAHGIWVTDHQHLDYMGKPICLKCPYEKYYVVRSQRACEQHFEERKND